MNIEIYELAKNAIKHASLRGASRESGSLGQLFGSWKKQRGVGDCMMQNAALAELAKPIHRSTHNQ